MKKRSNEHHLDGLIALLLFGVFAACVLAVLLTGADAYRRLTRRDAAAYDQRTCIQYIATRVRQADIAGALYVDRFGGADALMLYDGEGYVTCVYCYDGYLMELYTGDLEEMEPSDGEQIMAIQGLELTLEDRLLTVTATDAQGADSTLQICLRSGEGAAA